MTQGSEKSNKIDTTTPVGKTAALDPFATPAIRRAIDAARAPGAIGARAGRDLPPPGGPHPHPPKFAPRATASGLSAQERVDEFVDEFARSIFPVDHLPDDDEPRETGFTSAERAGAVAKGPGVAGRPEDALLTEREETHGDFSHLAEVSQSIKTALHAGPAYGALSLEQAEALDCIAVKLARIVCGNPDYADHWDDIIGYSRLAKVRP